jgi:hypothetical protein
MQITTLLPGASRLPTVVLSRCTLFLDGLAPRYRLPGRGGGGTIKPGTS